MYNIDQLRIIENTRRTVYNTSNQIGVSILFVDGSFSTENVLGVAYRNTSIAIFGGKINEISGDPLQPSTQLITTMVMNHEFAHLLGLVNNGSPMQDDHLDTQHPPHCNNAHCLMHYSVETTDIVNNFFGQVPDLDPNCLLDLAENGGK